MMNYATLIIYIGLFSIVKSAIPLAKDYFITKDNANCSFLTLSAKLSVPYNTQDGIRVSDITLDNSQNAQSGVCGSEQYGNVSQFKILLNGDQNLIFNFENLDNKVILRNIVFTYQLPSSLFPNATLNGSMVATSNINKNLSTVSQYYQCRSPTDVVLSNNVTLHVFSTKFKVFNVVNNSFGDQMAQCALDGLTSSAISTKLFADSTSSASSSQLSTLSTTDTSQSSAVTSVSSSQSATSSLVSTSPSTPSSVSASTSSNAPSSSSASTSLSTPSSSSASTSSSTPSSSSASTSSSTPSSTIRSSSSVVFTTNTPSLFTSQTTNQYRSTLAPGVPKFEIGDKTSVCLLLQGEMNIFVSYQTTAKDQSKSFPITANSPYNGTCSSKVNDITIYFANNSQFTLSFIKSNGLVKLDTMKTRIFLSSKSFPDAMYPNTNQTYNYKFDTAYEVDIGYYCASNSMLGNNTVHLDVKDFKFEAFRSSNNTVFDKNLTNCVKDPMVAIIVGIVLAVFLVIVIVLFVFFQIRAKRRQGYQEI